MPFRIEPTDILLIVLAAVLLFGPSRLPEIGRGIGKAISEFRLGLKGTPDGFREEMKTPGGGQQTGIEPSPPQQTPASSGGNYCIQCGAENPPRAGFCNQCGHAF